MYPPNILVTNFCNQNCSFCFALTEMNNQLIKKEMSLADFKTILLKMKKIKNKIDTVKILGGEPTLHSSFNKIINLSLKHFTYVQIFTNGIFSDEKASFLSQNLPRIKFTFNVVTPGFIFNKKIRENVVKRILFFSQKTEVTLSLTIDNTTDLEIIFKTIPRAIFDKVKIIRIGLSNPVAGEKNYYQFEDFPKIGAKFYQLIKNLKQINPKLKISLNCGLTRCMFTTKQYQYLKKNNIDVLGWGCFGKASSMDIQTDLSAFHCFPLSTKHRLKLKNSRLQTLNAKFLAKRYQYWSKIYQNVCKKCPFYGHKPNKCPGPCIAFLTNNFKYDLQRSYQKDQKVC